ncbi:RDD family protein [Nocardia terpenica]|uniref:RDD family protein n=1 Tax=Nocardia terpenica TaxID=455432 RepID=A0A291RC83_9NOCA|nr:RDD family protein [Nocardia terpenica]ATL64900.1 RDD family protein [Nocardia terpenica]
MAVFTTGEAVALELPIARIPLRAAAFLIDLLIQLTVAWLLLIWILGLLFQSELDGAWLDAAALIMIVAVGAGYPVVCETLLRGRTVGKLALGLRVVRGDGGPVDFRHALTRGLAGLIVDFWVLGGFGAIAVITSLCSPRARRVGDILADTVVIHDRVRLPDPALAVAPPWLAEWTRRLDLSGLSDDLALPIRQYLTRCPTLTPEVQQGLGHALVTTVCRDLNIVAPAGCPPVHLLGALLAERQRRALGLPVPPPAPGYPMPVPPSNLAWHRPT